MWMPLALHMYKLLCIISVVLQPCYSMAWCLVVVHRGSGYWMLHSLKVSLLDLILEVSDAKWISLCFVFSCQHIRKLPSSSCLQALNRAVTNLTCKFSHKQRKTENELGLLKVTRTLVVVINIGDYYEIVKSMDLLITCLVISKSCIVTFQIKCVLVIRRLKNVTVVCELWLHSNDRKVFIHKMITNWLSCSIIHQNSWQTHGVDLQNIPHLVFAKLNQQLEI